MMPEEHQCMEEEEEGVPTRPILNIPCIAPPWPLVSVPHGHPGALTNPGFSYPPYFPPLFLPVFSPSLPTTGNVPDTGIAKHDHDNDNTSNMAVDPVDDPDDPPANEPLNLTVPKGRDQIGAGSTGPTAPTGNQAVGVAVVDANHHNNGENVEAVSQQAEADKGASSVTKGASRVTKGASRVTKGASSVKMTNVERCRMYRQQKKLKDQAVRQYNLDMKKRKQELTEALEEKKRVVKEMKARVEQRSALIRGGPRKKQAKGTEPPAAPQSSGIAVKKEVEGGLQNDQSNKKTEPLEKV